MVPSPDTYDQVHLEIQIVLRSQAVKCDDVFSAFKCGSSVESSSQASQNNSTELPSPGKKKVGRHHNHQLPLIFNTFSLFAFPFVLFLTAVAHGTADGS